MTEFVDTKLISKWSLVCSVPDQEIVNQLSEFSTWFVEKLCAEAARIGVYFQYESKPSMIQYVKPGDMEGCTMAYEKIHKELPSTHMVLHILPQKHSNEYEWMKLLATRYGLVRQGILLDNALNRFADADVPQEDVFRNVAQWISRSSSKLCCSRVHGEKPYDIRVGTGTPCSTKLNYSGRLIQSAVNQVLHGADEHSVCRDESVVRVDGFPSELTEFGVAQLFGPLCISGVSLIAAGSALVTFANKFLAYQAAEFDKKILDRRHTLSVTPLSDEVVAQLKNMTVAN